MDYDWKADSVGSWLYAQHMIRLRKGLRRFDGFAGTEQQAGTAALPVKIVLEGTPEWESLKSKNPRLTARDIRTDGGVVRGTYDYGRAA